MIRIMFPVVVPGMCLCMYVCMYMCVYLKFQEEMEFIYFLAADLSVKGCCQGQYV